MLWESTSSWRDFHYFKFLYVINTSAIDFQCKNLTNLWLWTWRLCIGDAFALHNFFVTCKLESGPAWGAWGPKTSVRARHDTVALPFYLVYASFMLPLLNSLRFLLSIFNPRPCALLQMRRRLLRKPNSKCPWSSFCTLSFVIFSGWRILKQGNSFELCYCPHMHTNLDRRHWAIVPPSDKPCDLIYFPIRRNR